jgi:hypothetical protein
MYHINWIWGKLVIYQKFIGLGVYTQSGLPNSKIPIRDLKLNTKLRLALLMITSRHERIKLPWTIETEFGHARAWAAWIDQTVIPRRMPCRQ